MARGSEWDVDEHDRLILALAFTCVSMTSEASAGRYLWLADLDEARVPAESKPAASFFFAKRASNVRIETYDYE